MPIKLDDLQHVTVHLKSGGEIVVLNTGAVINAESEAMLQALHSRSLGGLRAHLGVLAQRGSDNFMRECYVGYDHKSIGDCGTTTIFVEGVSMLVAKAVQDSSLYSGQEASTRYIDFSKQPFIDPTQSQEGAGILENMRTFYLAAQEPTKAALRKLYLRAENKEKEATYEKAIAVRAFDITRSLLPAGASTKFAWHTNLRQAADRILFLRHHPLPEVRDVAEGLEKALQTHYPHSFGHKRYDATEAYQDLIATEYYYQNPTAPDTIIVDFKNIDREELARYQLLFSERPIKTELPKFLSQIGTVDAWFLLDFGSFRDIHRHRAINQRMPLLTTQLGFNSWYTENFPREVGEQLDEYVGMLQDKVRAFGISPAEEQYFWPMGYNTANRFTGDLPATIYMVELRDSRFVHPTLQNIAHYIGAEITRELGIPLHIDKEPNKFDVKRGR